MTRIIDSAGSGLFRLVPRFSLRPGAAPALCAPAIRKILLVRMAYLGDVVLTLPVLKPLRERFPAAEIIFLTSPAGAELLRGNPHLDRVMTLKPFWFYPGQGINGVQEYLAAAQAIRREKFDLAIDFRGDLRNILFLLFPSRARHRISYDITGGGYLLTEVIPYPGLKHKVEYHLDILRGMGISVNGREATIRASPEEQLRVRDLLLQKGVSEHDSLCAIHPGGRLPLKRWKPERYARLAGLAGERWGTAAVIVGDDRDREAAAVILSRVRPKGVSLVGEINVRELACLLRRCRLFIGNDSAPLHLASAVNAPALGIFGPSDSRETGPWGKSAKVVEKDLACRETCDEHRCRNNNYHECMNEIRVEDVFASVKELMDTNPLSKTQQLQTPSCNPPVGFPMQEL